MRRSGRRKRGELKTKKGELFSFLVFYLFMFSSWLLMRFWEDHPFVCVMRAMIVVVKAKLDETVWCSFHLLPLISLFLLSVLSHLSFFVKLHTKYCPSLLLTVFKMVPDYAKLILRFLFFFLFRKWMLFVCLFFFFVSRWKQTCYIQVDITIGSVSTKSMCFMYLKLQINELWKWI